MAGPGSIAGERYPVNGAGRQRLTSSLNVTGTARVRWGHRKTEVWARCSLNFVLLPNCPTRAHNQKVTGRGNVVKNLFVGNLGSEVTHEELRRLFEAYGEVVQVHIIVDRDTGLPRGFAFVEMTNDAEAERAIRGLNGSILKDRALDVNYARPRPERPAA